METNPYQSPSPFSDRMELPAAAAHAGFATPRFVVVPLLYVGAVTSMLHGFTLLSQLWLISRMDGGGDWSQDEVDMNDMLVGSGAILFVVLYVATIIAWWRWQLRAAHNLRAFGRRHFDFTPGWTIGWFFVPFANLFKPYQAMKEIYLASEPTVDVDGPQFGLVGGSALVGWWWAFWLLGNFAGRASARLPEETLDQIRTASFIGIGEAILHVLLCLVAATMIRRINRNQMSRAVRLQAA